MEVSIILSTLTHLYQIDVLYDLEGSGTDFTTLASLWTVSSLVTSGKKVYTCNGTPLLGGYDIMGTGEGQYLERTYTGVPAHNQIRLVFTLYPIDSWDRDGNDHFNVKIGSTEVTGWTLDWGDGTTSALCGDSAYADLPPIKIQLQVAHSGVAGSSVAIRVISYLDGNSKDESLGIRDVILSFETVDSPSQKFCCASSNTAVPTGATACTCSSSQYMTPSGSGSCYNCDGSCKTCTGSSSSQCSSCVDGKYLSGSSSKTCGTCHSSCATCSGPLETDCLTCNSGDYYADGQCFTYCNEPFGTSVVGANTVCSTPCPGQFAWKDTSCTPDCNLPYTSVITTTSLKACVCFNVVAPGQDCYTCDSSCLTCDGQQASQCLTCSDRFYLAIVDDDDDIDGTCESCDSSCLTCSGPSDSECLSCDPGLFLVDGACSSCDPSCLTCDGPSTTECLTCDSHFYLESDNSCNSCDDSCLDCSGPSYNQCKTCPTGSYLYNNNTCVASCNSPFLITEDATNKYCDTPCVGKYATEDGICISGCDALSTSYELYNLKACYCSTPNYRYWNNSCLSTCDSPLQSLTSNHCTCPYYLYKNNTCVTSCNSPFYITQDDSNKYCDTPCPRSYAMEGDTCSSVCDGVSVRSEFVTLKSCFCNSPNYRYWNDSCLTTCSFPLVSRTVGSKNYCDFPCASDEYLYENGICSKDCTVPYVPTIIAKNLYCKDLGCTRMKVTFVKATVTGFQYNLKLAPDSCDLPTFYINDMLNANEDAKEILKDFHFDVTKTGKAAYFLDLTLGASVLEDKTLNLNFTGLSGKMIVFSKFKAGAFVQQLAKMADSASSGVSFVTAVTVVSVIVFKSASSVWGFIGFQQLMNYYKYINIQYPFQIEMLFNPSREQKMEFLTKKFLIDS